jgi:hypothetical protein
MNLDKNEKQMSDDEADQLGGTQKMVVLLPNE